jgi:hypothetical protein
MHRGGAPTGEWRAGAMARRQSLRRVEEGEGDVAVSGVLGRVTAAKRW